MHTYKFIGRIFSVLQHCLQGWQTAKPSTIPTASTVDIKQGIKDKEILVSNSGVSIRRKDWLWDRLGTPER